MSGTIDKRIVDMQFNNREFERGVQTSLGSIKNLKQGLNFDGAGKGLLNIGNIFKTFSLAKITGDVDSLNSKFSAFGVAGFALITRMTDGLINMGKQIINSVTGLEAAKAGLMEYETQINSIQTIMANTSSKGTTMAEVKTALAELNEYSDKTIYNFTEMTKNIGTFTAAGTDLDTSVAAIKGIANLAAVSGSNSQQAATAMYQLSQAISAGTVRLMDWNSVTNAGMGGEIFKDALIDTARVHGIAIDKMIEDEGGFRTSLDKGWLSSEIMLETLSKFTGDLNEEQLLSIGYTKEQATEIMKLGDMANDAATKVKTFTQLKGTLKEMAQSGWTKTWELLIGDFDQAKYIFTDMSNALGAIISATSDARNKVLNTWNKLGGRDSVIVSVSTAFKLLLQVVEPVKEAFKEIFPPITGEALMRFTYLIQGLIQKIQPTVAQLTKLKIIFKAVFAVLDIGKMFIISLVKAIGNLLKPLGALGGGLSDTLMRISQWIFGLRTSIKTGELFDKAFAKIVEAIHKFVGNMIVAGTAVKDFGIKAWAFISETGAKIAGVFTALKPLGDGLVTFFKTLGQGLGKAFATFKLVDTSGIEGMVQKVKDFFNGIGGVSLKSGEALSKFDLFLIKIKEHLGKMAEAAKNALKWLGDLMTEGISKISFENVLDGLNTGLLFSLTTGLNKFLTGGFLAAITLAITNFINKGSGVFDGISGILNGVKGSLEAWQNSLKAKTLMEIAKAIGLIALSVLALSFVDPTKLAFATGAITVLFADLMTSMALFDKISGGSNKGMAMLVASMLGMSAALLILSVALLIISKLDWEEMAVGLTGLAGITILLVGTAKLLSKNSKTFITASIGVTSFAIGLLALSGVVYLLGKMDVKVLQQGLLALTAIVAEFVLFTRLIGSGTKTVAAALSMAILAGGILILSKSVKSLGEMNPTILQQGLIGMGAGLLILFAALKIMPADMLIKSVGLLAIGYAMSELGRAISGMGKMSWEQVAIGLTVLAGSLVILAAGLYLMSGSLAGAAALVVASFALTILAGALTVMGKMPMKAIASALLLLVGVFAIFGVAALVLGPLVPILLALGGAMLLFGIAALAFGVGISTLAAGIAVLAVSGAAGVAVFALFLTTILSMLPMIVTQLGLAFAAWINTIITNAPLMFEALKTILLGLISTLVEVIPEMIAAIVTVVTALVEGLVTLIPMVVGAAFTLIMALLTEIRNNIGQMTTVGIEIVTEFIDAVAAKIPDVITSAFNLIISFVDGLTQSVEDELPRLIESVKNLGIAVIDGLIAGLGPENVLKVIDKIKEIGGTILDTLKEILGINSPSKPAMEDGKSIIEGLVLGITSNAKYATQAVEDLGKRAVSGLGGVMSNLSEALGLNLDMSPTIRPVLDLTNIIDGAKEIEGYLENKTTLELAASARPGSSDYTAEELAKMNGSESVVTPSSIIFNQTNNSPKALSRLEIYRQTKNQLTQLKGLVKTS